MPVESVCGGPAALLAQRSVRPGFPLEHTRRLGRNRELLHRLRALYHFALTTTEDHVGLTPGPLSGREELVVAGYFHMYAKKGKM